MEDRILQMLRMVNPDVPESFDTKLFDEGYLDSFSAYMVLTRIELELDVSVTENDVSYDNFKDINAIARFVSRKLEEKQ